jgi:hypothetical protein
MPLFEVLSRKSPEVAKEKTGIPNQEGRSPCQDLNLRSPECYALDPPSHLKEQTYKFKILSTPGDYI